MKKSQKGFTIIEVALVLAIGALIFLVVFLAVPALQRNQRNDARHRDVSNIVTAVSSWAANNTQTNLATATGASGFNEGQNQIDGTTGTGNNGNGPESALGKYLDSVSSNTEEVVVKTFNSSTDVDASGKANAGLYTNDDDQPVKVTVVMGATCNGTTGLQAGAARSAAVVGSTETTGEPEPYCSTAS